MESYIEPEPEVVVLDLCHEQVVRSRKQQAAKLWYQHREEGSPMRMLFDHHPLHQGHSDVQRRRKVQPHVTCAA